MSETAVTRPTVLLTGPTRGLGRALVDVLLDRDDPPHLVLAGRSPAPLTALAASVHERGGSAEVLAVDLSDLRSVERAAEVVRGAVTSGRLPHLQALVANAGTQFYDRRHAGAQGHEETFAVNVLAQHVLLRGLRDTVDPDGLVVLLGSSSHRGRRATFGLLPSPVWRDPAELSRPDLSDAGRTGTAGGRAYADSKLALVTLAHAWSRELDGHPRLAVYDPGLVPGTGLGRNFPGYRRWVWENLMPAMQLLPGAASARGSARHLARLALGEEHADRHGVYVELGRVTEPHPDTLRRDRQDRLWQVCEQLTRPVGV